ncbi:peptidoglycan/xylan/chitin deacetylase (PgdA/CDA1 family) [Microbacterium resistens]|uniref:Peptidoglycan/xylan/chitin deacetylase (PgdA/CDA1 family) n=1 Tax=Microbacterium resistens TaxID=156977 RepID=A0ABU1SEH6_9MICO|nr:polysaccharide deacetylase family protein [Microbacterium resistens]MDR6867977.1 peptidoglycan/xylan/chitin deacetylase (PgdA/CDA1 family) [Microbacterium resistens]
MTGNIHAWGRRTFLAATGLAIGTFITACGGRGEVSVDPAATSTPAPRPLVTAPRPTPTLTIPPAPQLVRVPAPVDAFTALPGEGNLLAWTVDDGSDSAVVRAYAQFAAETHTRLTLFATGSYSAWADNVDVLKPLVSSGQVQLANHTWSHPDLQTLSDHAIIDELQRTHDRIGELYGVDARPFYRPPYGFHDHRVREVAASIGYTSPVLWYGSLADSGLIPAEEILRLGHEWFLPQHIVIGHLNHTPVTTVFPQLAQIIAERGLRTVTLNDVFTSPQHP